MQKAAGMKPWARFGAAMTRIRLPGFGHAYQREVFLVGAFGLAAFYMTALYSFNPLDTSFVAQSFPAQTPENLAGAFGANLASIALFLFGVVAWILPIPLLASATLVALKSPKALARSRVFGWALAIASLAVLFALKRPEITWRGFEFPSGGALGQSLAGLLKLWFGEAGGLIIIATVALCSVIMIMRRAVLAPIADKAKQASGSTWNLRPLWWDQALWRRTPRAEPLVAPAPAAAMATNVAPAPAIPLVTMPSEPTVMGDFVDDEEESPSSPADEVGVGDLPPPIAARGGGLLSRFKKQMPDALRAGHDEKVPHTFESKKIAYAPPPVSVFNRAEHIGSGGMTPKELEATATLLVKTFEDFGVHGKVIGYQPGPVVTVFEYQADAGVKQSKVLGLIDDLALALKVDSIFIHPVRGKSALGVQVPNPKREQVHLGDIITTSAFRESDSPLTFGMGKSLNGQPMCADLAAMPHLLVAGATGSGKSVAVNSMLCSIIMKSSPDDVRMILVDPKMLELSVYEGIPHLLMPVITEPGKASLALKWAAHEMERRYKLMQHAAVRNIAGYNTFLAKASADKKDELRAATGTDTLEKLPYILLVIDELADLMMTAPKDVESSIQRLAQKARASGIHMVLATQRPSVDIITGVIKANLPCRIAFQVVSKHDSRTILDLNGAEKLLGKGDMLLQRPGAGRLERMQGALITDEEVINLAAAAKAQGTVQYDDNIIAWIDDEYARQKDGGEGDDMAISMDDDPKFDEAMSLARAHGHVSASFLQRHLKIGYNRAARIVEFMESKGLVDKADGAKPRKWLGPGAA
jgi:S-DNA-T family DNA segregation ATPase FtsK/SpoIIIE